VCAYCGGHFRARARVRSYCSRSCSAAARRAGIEVACFTCGRLVPRPGWFLRRHLYTFCSPLCRVLGWGELQRLYRAIDAGGALRAERG
jgi:endogenous inhibitor of DNA gyrase (YacG/DUF329 family)